MMPAMKQHNGVTLLTLLEGLLDASLLSASAHIVVDGIAQDSRQVDTNYLFIAVRGTATHGLNFAEQAVASGASVVLWDDADDDCRTILSVLKHEVLCLQVTHLQHKVGEIASRFFNHPSQGLNLIGVTGTDGKTSVSHYIAQCINSKVTPCGLLGTLGNGLVHDLKPTGLTTASAIAVQQSLAWLVKKGAKAAAMEVSSHGLDQGRVNGVEFDTAVFTNLSQDHLDYHGNMDAYFRAKSKLFEIDGLKSAVINLDDACGRELAEKYWNKLTLYGYSASTDIALYAPYANHIIYTKSIKPTRHGFEINVVTPVGSGYFELNLLGSFNVSNALAVLATLILNNMVLEQALMRLHEIRPVAGRMELIESENRPTVIVDYAHTPQGLASACRAAKQHFSGKLWCVFGCGGDRDREKRPLMARAAEEFADNVVVTSDNPRHEQPEIIIKQILDGFTESDAVVSYIDRRDAISHVIAQAKADDVILIAGKGHEAYQIVGDEYIGFDDRMVVRELLGHGITGVSE